MIAAAPIRLLGLGAGGVRATAPPPDIAAALAAAADANPDADVFRLDPSDARPTPAWRGRRCRSHERNLESLRFAAILAPGTVAARGPALEAALTGPPLREPDDWRELTRLLCAGNRVVSVAAAAPAAAGFPTFAPVEPCDVLVFGQIEVSTSLYFDFLEARADLVVRFRAPTRLAVDAPHLTAARLVVLVRTLHRFWDEGVIAFLEAAGVPWVWFTDDNFQALAAERGAPGFFTEGRMRRALVGAAQVWASTPALAEALAPLHPRARIWGAVLDPALADASRPPPADRLTLAAPGGDFRIAGLAGGPIRALAGLAADAPLRIVGTERAAAVLAPDLAGAEIVAMPTERSFRQFVRQWRAWKPDLVLHPAGSTANARYKCPTAAIVAGYLDAVPLVADEPAYAGWGEAEGVLRLENLADAARSAKDQNWRGAMRGRLARTLAGRFADDGRVERLRALARPSVGDAARPLSSLGLKRAALGLAHATRRLRDLAWRPG